MEHLQGKTDKTCSVTRLAPVYVFQKLARDSFCSRTLPCLLRKITFRSVCIVVLDPIPARTALLKLFLVNLRWLGVTFAVGAPALCFSQLTESTTRSIHVLRQWSNFPSIVCHRFTCWRGVRFQVPLHAIARSRSSTWHSSMLIDRAPDEIYSGELFISMARGQTCNRCSLSAGHGVLPNPWPCPLTSHF